MPRLAIDREIEEAEARLVKLDKLVHYDAAAMDAAAAVSRSLDDLVRRKSLILAGVANPAEPKSAPAAKAASALRLPRPVSSEEARKKVNARSKGADAPSDQTVEAAAAALAHVESIFLKLATSRSPRTFTQGHYDGIVSFFALAADGLKDLAKRLEAVEKREANLKYVGVWEHGRPYVPGNFCTDDGSIWHCKEATNTRPGQSDRWTLAVKKGRDAERTRR